MQRAGKPHIFNRFHSIYTSLTSAMYCNIMCKKKKKVSISFPFLRNHLIKYSLRNKGNLHVKTDPFLFSISLTNKKKDKKLETCNCFKDATNLGRCFDKF